VIPWIDRIPKIRLLKMKQHRIRWLTVMEAQRLIEECPDHLKALVQFSLATGLRMSNVTRLEWSQVDLTRKVAWIHPDQAKARRAIAVPLNSDAMSVLIKERGKHGTYVFTYYGRPIKASNTQAFKNALERANIKDFRWHDLRHTWASWHAQNGTPLHVLKELGGWESMEMVQRYAHLAAEHTAPFAETISRVTISSQSQIVPFKEDSKCMLSN
jgi:integrase